MENSGTSLGSSVGLVRFCIPHATTHDMTGVSSQKEEKFALFFVFDPITFKKSLLHLTVVCIVAMVLVN